MTTPVALLDIVERLRGPIMLATDHSDRREAADEIEALRSNNENLIRVQIEERDAARRAISEASSEIERLNNPQVRAGKASGVRPKRIAALERELASAKKCIERARSSLEMIRAWNIGRVGSAPTIHAIDAALASTTLPPPAMTTGTVVATTGDQRARGGTHDDAYAVLIGEAARVWADAFKAYWAFKGVTSIASLDAHEILIAAEKALLAALAKNPDHLAAAGVRRDDAERSVDGQAQRATEGEGRITPNADSDVSDPSPDRAPTHDEQLTERSQLGLNPCPDCGREMIRIGRDRGGEEFTCAVCALEGHRAATVLTERQRDEAHGFDRDTMEEIMDSGERALNSSFNTTERKEQA